MRMIDADAFTEKYGDYYAEEGPEWGFIGKVGQLISEQPTIEAKPVRHGRWILCEDQHGVDNDNNNYAYFCSQCHYQDVHSKYAKVNFCWHCGAKMDGGADNG